MEINARVRAKDILAVLTLNVHQVIRPNVCARWAIVVIHSEDVQVKTNALILRVPMVHNVSMKKAATNAFVQKVKLETLTKVAAFWKMDLLNRNVQVTNIVRKHWHAFEVAV